ncbi:MAG: AraC family transcriptional regulator [Gammaproteobacteria bacterium]|nr:AraC family transcriptional regulator [Gammaproteobacteria bacterium]
MASYIDAWNQCDAEAVADHLTQNGTYCDIPLNQELTRKALVADPAALFAHEHYRYELVGEALSSETTIAFQYKVTPLDPTGSQGTGNPWFGAEFMTVNSKAAIRIADYYEISPDSVDPVRVSSSEQASTKYARSGLGNQQMEKYKSQLVALMHTEKMYLRSDLTLPKLAVLVNCSVNHLSQVLNAGFGMSFFDFMNSYRIEDAKRILGGEQTGSHAILDIPFAVGFNTNSAFYSAFKKSTGQTPAQYRRTRIKMAQPG